MTPDTSHSIDYQHGSWEHRHLQRAERTAAVRRSEAVLRILKNRSTIVDEAVRMSVDVETVVAWLAATYTAIRRALDRDPESRADSQRVRRTSDDFRDPQRHVLTT